VPVRAEVEAFPLAEANDALAQVRSGRARGSTVLVP
jgi:D-arabinose 1-dehydrogenase-like Zn-dependent alcohol dehydrogenase